ncbi:putative membrane protein [Salinibacter ruber]|jgi:uncharacterized membrane protein|nr:putative membrane protein [Salinibacter ruber]
MSAAPLSASAKNRLFGAALLAVALMWALLFPLDGLLAWFVFGMVLGAGTGGLLTGNSVWGLKRWLSRSPLVQQ